MPGLLVGFRFGFGGCGVDVRRVVLCVRQCLSRVVWGEVKDSEYVVEALF